MFYSNSAAMNPKLERQQKKKKTNPPSPSFSSLPNEIIVSCLARMSQSYYPKLSLVCKTFRSLILSMDLTMARFHVRTFENVLHVCLQLSDDLPPTWYSLWLKPDQTLTNNIGKKQKLTGKTLLVPTPSSYYPRVPLLVLRVGSDYYALTQTNAPSSVLWVLDKDVWLWRKFSNMTVARERAVACVLDGKIYVMGGCKADETANWAEVFDTRTQTWEPLPDPGEEIRFSKIKKLEVTIGKLFLRCNGKKDYGYDPKQGKWDDGKKGFMCLINNVYYVCDEKRRLRYFDIKLRELREIKGIATLTRYCGGDDVVDVANYNGKLLILWNKFTRQGCNCQHKNIWCAVIALERRNDEVWGKVEWASVVLTVPSSYVFLRSRMNKVT